MTKTLLPLPIHKRAQLGIGYLAQEPSIFLPSSIEDNILLVLDKLIYAVNGKLE